MIGFGRWSRLALLGVAALWPTTRDVRAAEGDAKLAARLIYSVPEKLAECPDERSLRDAVAARLGYNPFNVQAERTISARISRGKHGLKASVELSNAAGEITGLRQLESAKGDCRELGSAMELAITVAIDPMVLARPHSIVPDGPVVPAPKAAPRRDKVTLRASFGALASLGSAPAINFGFAAQIGLRWRIASFALEGRADLPASATTAPPSGVESQLFLASFVPCVHYRFALACALVSLGALQGKGIHVDRPRDETTFYSAAGVRIGAEIHLVSFLSLRISLDVLGTLTRTTLTINDAASWTTPPVSGNLGLSLVGDFL